MSWLRHTIGTSVGKKMLMAATGLCFIGFLTIHLAGNLTLLGGGDRFNAYAAHLHALGPFLTAAELILLLLAAVHVITGAWLFVQNLRARPVRYAVTRRSGGRTVGSATMPYSGILIFAFVIYHLSNFSFADHSGTTIHAIVSAAFADPTTVAVYLGAMVLVGLHVRHGFWSLFQTLGANHPKYMPFVMRASIALGVLLGIGFGLLPIYVALAG